MARRRNNSSLPEFAVGISMFVVAITVFNPKLREQIFSTVTAIVSLLLFLGVVGLTIYLFIQSRKSKVNSFSASDQFSTDNVIISLKERFPNAFKQIPTKDIEPYIQPKFINRFSDNSLEEMRAHKHVAKPVEWNISILQVIEWKRFEKVCTEYLRISGYEAKETSVGADGGVDIRVYKPDVENSEGIVQCKSWNTYKVGVKPVRELFGVMAAEHVSTGIFMTSGDFTSEAEEFAQGKIKLISGAKFIHLIKKLSEEDQNTLLNIAIEGDYITPTCPQCDLKMTLKESKKGRSAGGLFWGCIKYPRCKQTFIYKDI